MGSVNTRGGISRKRVLTGAVAIGLVVTAGCSLRSPRYSPQYSANPFSPQGTSSGYGYTGAQAGATGGGTAVQAGGSGAGAGGADPMQRLGAADQALRAQNYQPVGQVFRQVVPARGLVGYPIPAQPGMCYTVFAIGGSGVDDIDMEVFSPSNTELGEDRNPDPHPHVSFCAREFGMHIARVSMYRGSGEVIYAVYQGPPGSSGVNLSAVLGGGGSGPQGPSQPDTTTQGRIQALAAQLRGDGYQPSSQPVGMTMAQGAENSWQLNLSQGTCYAFATFGGPGVNDSDVFLFNAAGSSRVAADAGTAVDAVIRDFCPESTGTYQLRARLYRGAGPVWVMAFSRGVQGGPGGGGGASEQSNLQIAQNTGTGGGLEAFFRRVDRDLQSRGYASDSNSITNTLESGGVADVPVDLRAGTCYAIAAAGDSTVEDLDLVLLDASGNEVDRDHAQDARPVVRVCPQVSGRFTMRVRMVRGGGQYRAGLFRWEGGTSGAGMQGVLFVRNAEITRLLQADGYTGDANFELGRGRIAQGSSRSHNVNLESGACYAFVAVGGAGVSDLNLAVQRGRTTVVEDNNSTAFPMATRCPAEGGAHRVTIRSVVGSGEYVFRVFRRQNNPATSASR